MGDNTSFSYTVYTLDSGTTSTSIMEGTTKHATFLLFLTSAAAMCESIDIQTTVCPFQECMCIRAQHFAKCSGYKRNLTTIPKLPAYINYVWLKEYYFPVVTKATFDPIKNNKIMNISLCNSKIQHINPNAFEMLDNLTSLDLSSNIHMNVSSLKYSLFSLKSPTLHQLRFNQMKWMDLSLKIFIGVRRKINFVSLSENKIQQLSDGIFDGLEKLEVLFIDGNNISTCAKTLKQLESLMKVDLSRNSINSCNSYFLPETLETLNLRSNYLTEVPNFCSMNGTSNVPRLKTLNLLHNLIYSISKRTFDCLPFLTELNLGENNISTCAKSLKQLESLMKVDLSRNRINSCNSYFLPETLETLNLRSNYLTEVPNFCSMNGTSNVPRLKTLNLLHNLIYSISKRTFDCLPSLRELNLGENDIERIPSNTFSSLTRLQDLFLTNMKLKLRSVERNAFSIPSLIQFNFEQNHFKFSFRGETKEVGLNKCTNLEVLDLSYNHLPKWIQGAKKVFGRLLKLKFLYLRNVFWNLIPDGFFKLFPIVEIVTLSNNGITKLNHTLFSDPSQIKQLLVEANQIAQIANDTFTHQFWQRIKKFDLSSNPFLCECSLLWFRDKLRTSAKKFSQYPGQYKCLSPPERKGVYLSKFDMTSDDCKEKSELLTVLLLSGSVCLVAIMSISAVYKGRWHIRYWIYLLRYRRSEYRRLGEVEFRYDAFVIYADDDSDFVHDTLLPKLEGEEHHRLCVHFRDFQPGKIIVDNIVESMSNSRMAIVMLSKSFCESRWCKFELIIAQDRWLNNESDALLIVMLEDLESDHMTPDLRALIRTTTYIMWTEDSLGQRLFWEQILNTLRRQN